MDSSPWAVAIEGRTRDLEGHTAPEPWGARSGMRLASLGTIVVLTTGLLFASDTLRPQPGAGATPAASPAILPAGVEFVAGTTHFLGDAWGLGSPRLILTVPAMGWFGAGSDLGKGVISATSNSVTVWLTPWNVENLNVDPYHSRTQGLLGPAVGADRR